MAAFGLASDHLLRHKSDVEKVTRAHIRELARDTWTLTILRKNGLCLRPGEELLFEILPLLDPDLRGLIEEAWIEAEFENDLAMRSRCSRPV